MRNRTIVVTLASTATLALGAGWGARVLDRQAQEREVLEAVEGLYGVISGDAGEERDWEAFRGMFLDDSASMTAQRQEAVANGVAWSFFSMTPDRYVEQAGGWFERRAFYERGIANEIEVYGSLAHVWSTYQAFDTPDAAGPPVIEGINSIQLVKTDGGWKVLSLAWVDVNRAGEIPERYRPDDG
ncbi:MAG: hypothetical protein DHS20C14_22320 [Phycisphaeraceae bacterium]|nr:MAG: hypothetical protein DHS20C14_22320 [Phycisphaeraceae bacterium]